MCGWRGEVVGSARGLAFTSGAVPYRAVVCVVDVERLSNPSEESLSRQVQYGARRVLCAIDVETLSVRRTVVVAREEKAADGEKRQLSGD